MSTKFLNGVLPFGSGKMAFWCLPGFLLCRLIMISMDPQNAMHWVWQDSIFVCLVITQAYCVMTAPPTIKVL